MFVKVPSTPPRASVDDMERFRKYAERLQASLRRVNYHFSLRFDRVEGKLDFIDKSSSGSSRFNIDIRNADHLKDIYCAFTLQYGGDVDEWCRGVKRGDIASFQNIQTP